MSGKLESNDKSHIFKQFVNRDNLDKIGDGEVIIECFEMESDVRERFKPPNGKGVQNVLFRAAMLGSVKGRGCG